MLVPGTETKIVVAGNTLLVHYPLSALRAIETALNVSVPKLAVKISEADLRIDEIIEILHQGLRGANNAYPRPEVEAMVEKDYMGALTGAGEAFAMSFMPDEADAEKQEAQEGESLGE